MGYESCGMNGYDWLYFRFFFGLFVVCILRLNGGLFLSTVSFLPTGSFCSCFYVYLLESFCLERYEVVSMQSGAE
jgi:hypothetical protein